MNHHLKSVNTRFRFPGYLLMKYTLGIGTPLSLFASRGEEGWELKGVRLLDDFYIVQDKAIGEENFDALHPRAGTHIKVFAHQGDHGDIIK